MSDIRLKRAYEPASPDDGARVLVERLWPRGVSKAEAALAAWERDIAPSPALRKWYNHEPARWPEFRTRYLAELDGHGPALDRLGALARSGPLTLVLAARDSGHSSAAVLRERLLGEA
ncbi:MAG TPA: DUF488 family protein [Amaricoccus sp.]|nr:DUF488 family protein [Amaricoccus sp.]